MAPPKPKKRRTESPTRQKGGENENEDESVKSSNSEKEDDGHHNEDGSNSGDEGVQGVNRDEIDYGNFEEEHNYSITKRWENRVERWTKWMEDNKVLTNLDLDNLPLLTGDELNITIDDSSHLGRRLVAFAKEMQKYKDKRQTLLNNIQTLPDDIQTLSDDIKTLSDDNQTLPDDIQTLSDDIKTLSDDIKTLLAAKQKCLDELGLLETIKTNYEAELKSLKEQAANPGTASAALMMQLISAKEEIVAAKVNEIKLIEDKVELIDGNIASKEKTMAAKEETMTAKEETMAAKEETKEETMAGKRNEITAKRNEIADKKEKIASAEENARREIKDFLTFINAIWNAHKQIRNKFSYVNGMGNESLITIPSQVPRPDPTRVNVSKIAGPSDFDSFRPTPDMGFKDGLLDLLSQAENVALESLQQFVIDLMNCPSTQETDDADMVKATTDAILDWETGAAINTTIQYAWPPTNCDKETTADQPILHAIICRIIRLLAMEDASQVIHECEDGVTTEQSVAGSNILNRKQRRIDVTASKHEEHLALVLAWMVEKAIEIKTARKERGKLKKSTEKGRSQNAGLLGKKLLHAFDFGGAGQEASAFGICLTPMSIEVVQMSLSKIGTEDVALDMIGTGCVPLLGKELIAEKQKDAFDSWDTNGILLLGGALKYKNTLEFDPQHASVKQVLPTKLSLTLIKYLGSGAFSNVFQLHTEGSFLKIPKSAALESSLEHEALILRKLRSGQEGANTIIPVLEIESGLSTIRVVINGEISNMKALRLRGIVGVPLHRLPFELWTTHSFSIISAVFDALHFAHRLWIYHLDVRPGNIIVNVSEDECLAMLSDWGCAVDGTDNGTLKENKTLESFRGCTPYAHDRFLGTFKGTLDEDLDFASLAYSIHHVCNRKLKWAYQFDRPMNIKQHDLEFRRKLVCEWLNVTDDVPEKFKKALENACCLRRSARVKGKRKREEEATESN